MKPVRLIQQDCGDGLPCGRLPWDLPALPVLASPTPMPTMAITIQPTQVSGAVPTPVPITPNPVLQPVDTSGINDQMSTLQAIIAQTPMVVYDLQGTPVDTTQTFSSLELNAETFLGYAKSITTDQFGAISPLLTFVLVAFFTILAVKTMTFTLPFAGVLFGIIRKVINTILDFLPF